jgi:hypothetical protein
VLLVLNSRRPAAPAGLLSRVVPLRRTLHQEWLAGGQRGQATYPLKLIIMSATLRIEDFTGNKRWGLAAPAGQLQASCLRRHTSRLPAWTQPACLRWQRPCLRDAMLVVGRRGRVAPWVTRPAYRIPSPRPRSRPPPAAPAGCLPAHRPC